MTRQLPWIDESVEDLAKICWHMDIGRAHEDPALFRELVRKEGLEHEIRSFLKKVILRKRRVTATQWGDLFNIAVRTPDDVREDAQRFWEWLFDGEQAPGRE